MKDRLNNFKVWLCTVQMINIHILWWLPPPSAALTNTNTNTKRVSHEKSRLCCGGPSFSNKELIRDMCCGKSDRQREEKLGKMR